MSDEMPCLIQFDVIGCCRDTVVVGQEHVWFTLDGFPYALVDLSRELKKRTHVLFQQTGSVTFIKFCQTFSGYNGNVCFVIGIAQICGKAWNFIFVSVKILKIQFYGNSGLFGNLVKIFHVYNLVVDVVSADDMAGRQFALVGAVCQDEGIYANQIFAQFRIVGQRIGEFKDFG